MPRPVEGSGRYVPALDGVRALAVALVIGYHLGVPGSSGGLLGVGVFFTLSGFLITGILLSTWHHTGRIGLGRFYLQRARRLLPAVAVVLVVVLLSTLLVDRAGVGAVGTQVLAAALYVSNWQTIAAGDSYFQRFAGPGPLDHLWSLAVEEQFYLVWPVLLLALVMLPRVSLRVVAWVTGVLAAVSFGWLWLAASPGFDNTRAYEGTDTRAGGLLVGAVVAIVMWQPTGPPRWEGLSPRRLDRWAVIGLVVLAGLVAFTDEYSMFLYHGGLLLLSLATATVLAVVAQPESRVGRVLGWRPFTWVGERSYGIYLWHLPVIVFTPTAVLADRPLLRGAVLVGVTVGLAALSWALVEDPIRRRGLRGALLVGRYGADGRRRAVPAVAAASGALVLVATSALSAQALVVGEPPAAAAANAAGAVGLDRPPVPSDATPEPAPHPDARRSAGARTSPSSATPSPSAATAVTAPTGATATGALRTRCTELVHVGDSTSIGLTDPTYQPDPKARIDVQYARVGVRDFTADISGARSIVEHFQGRPNAEEAVASRADRGYKGCWTLALGVNEAANQYVGGVVPLARRIDLVMRHIPRDSPVLWLTVKTLNSGGPYGDAGMRAWNAALLAACTRYPNMRVYDWRSEVRSSWFIYDRTHYSTAGYTQRAARIADALAVAFPASGTSPSSCLVRSGR
jgi:peptidoglycan/LPS O-acetylase OafA/YrhL